MKSLKSKFGKFAISQTEAKKINGGTPPQPEERWECWSASGRVYYLGSASVHVMVGLVGSGMLNGCSSMS